jgi:hypothetical protein
MLRRFMIFLVAAGAVFGVALSATIANPVVQPIYPNNDGDLQPAVDLGSHLAKRPHVRTMHAQAVRSAIRHATSYNLHVTSAVRNGDFMIANRVVVFDGRGKVVLDARNVDPIFFARVAPGRYTVIATSGNQQEARTVLVSTHNQAQVNFLW